MQLEGKTAAVIGLARAGIPAAKFLAQHGAHVIGYDSKNYENLSPAALELETLGVQLRCGEHGFAGIEACDLIVLSPGLKVHYEPLQPLIAAAEARGAEVIGELELAARFCPCPMIAVTGTKGKSTTVKLITEMLRACGVDAHSAGNTGTPLIEMLPQLTSESWAVVEVSSFQLEKAPTFRPRVAVLLSLLEDHQDFHPTLEQYWETKLKIFSNQEEGDFALCNADDPRVLELMLQHDEWRAMPTTCRTPEEISEIRWSIGPTDTEGKYIPVVYGDEARQHLYWFTPPAQTGISVEQFPLRGQHNLSNLAAALGAVGMVVNFGTSLLSSRTQETSTLVEAIQNVVNHFESLPHRLEVVARKNGVTWVNDSQSTIPDASIAALRAFPAPVSLLLGGKAKIEASAYENLMRAVRDAKAKIYLYGEAAPMLRQVALSTGVEKSYIFEENLLAEVMRIAKMNESHGETVVLSPACASFDQFQSYEHRGESFRRLVRELPE